MLSSPVQWMKGSHVYQRSRFPCSKIKDAEKGDYTSKSSQIDEISIISRYVYISLFIMAVALRPLFSWLFFGVLSPRQSVWPQTSSALPKGTTLYAKPAGISATRKTSGLSKCLWLLITLHLNKIMNQIVISCSLQIYYSTNLYFTTKVAKYQIKTNLSCINFITVGHNSISLHV